MNDELLSQREWIEAWFGFVRLHNDGSELLTSKSKIISDYSEIQDAWVAGFAKGKEFIDERSTR